MLTLGLSDPRSPDEPGAARVDIGTIVQLVVYVVAVTLAYASLSERITKLEVKYDRIAQDIAEIKADLKTLLERRP